MSRTVIDRIREARARFVMKHDLVPDQIFLGPQEYGEFSEWARGDISVIPQSLPSSEFMDMQILGLASAGVRCGISSDDNP